MILCHLKRWVRPAYSMINFSKYQGLERFYFNWQQKVLLSNIQNWICKNGAIVLALVRRVIFLENSLIADFKMDFYNPDSQSFVEMDRVVPLPLQP